MNRDFSAQKPGGGKEYDQPVIPPDLLEQIKQFAGQLDPLYNALPPDKRKLQLWAQAQPAMYDAENSQREWSSESFAVRLSKPQAGTLGRYQSWC